jgi:predicted pyridoxine 5'-phosphate oxidase superfamily flavin-nucleotide-binding protein
MVKVSEEMRLVFEKQRLLPMASADASCKPNVIYVGMWWWEDEETLVVVDNFLNKTRKNIDENPWVSFVAWDREARKSFQIKCSAQLQSEGPLYEKGREKATSRERPFPGRAVVVLRVEEVYQASAGPDAGKRLL